jgi:uncharacterized protein (TIGR03067 family)
MRVPLAVIGIVLVSALPSLAQEPTGDLKALQGAWTGMVGPNKDFPITLTFEKSSVTISLTTPEGEEVTIKGEIKLDESKTPRQLDWINFTLPDGTKPETNLAIYEIKGDEFKVCSGGPGQDRPTEFKDDPNGMPNLVVFTRKKASQSQSQ